MLDWLLHVDKEIFIAINGAGTPYLDGFMIFLSERFVWFPMYLWLAYRLYQFHGLKFYQPLIALLLVILITDQTSSTFMKPYFERLRPCKDPGLTDIIVIIDNCRGKFGFVSGHAANAFGLASFYYLKEKSTVGIALLFWAALVSYSRVYLGVHYPGDVLAGAFLGFIAAYTIISAYKRLSSASEHIHPT